MITPRLEMILRHIYGNSCADIGTDHAYIPIELSKCGMRVIASDIMPGPLKIAAENVKKQKANVELRLGGGLAPIEKDEVETVIIAGMGGEMIEKILSEASDKTQSPIFVLQPMNGQFELRKFLLNNGFKIIEEDLAVEGFKVYNLIVATKNGTKSAHALSYNKDIDFHLPPSLYENPCFSALIAKKKREFSKIITGLKKSKEERCQEIEKLTRLLSEIEETERKVKK